MWWRETYSSIIQSFWAVQDGYNEDNNGEEMMLVWALKPKPLIMGAPHGVLLQHWFPIQETNTSSQVCCSGSQPTRGGNFTWTLQRRFKRLISPENIPVHPKITRQIKVFLGGTWECWTRNDCHNLPTQVDIFKLVQLLKEGITMKEKTWPSRTEWNRHQLFGVHVLHIFFSPRSFKILYLNGFCHLKLPLECAPSQTTSGFL